MIPPEAPKGRRVDVVGALAPDDPTGPRLVFETRRKAEVRYDAAPHLDIVRRLAGEAAAARTRPCVVVLDNDSVHHSRAVKDDTSALAASDLHRCFHPPYSFEPNPIEPVWRQVTYQDIPRRGHPTDTALQSAVESALATRARHLRESTTNVRRPASYDRTAPCACSTDPEVRTPGNRGAGSTDRRTDLA